MSVYFFTTGDPVVCNCDVKELCKYIQPRRIHSGRYILENLAVADLFVVAISLTDKNPISNPHYFFNANDIFLVVREIEYTVQIIHPITPFLLSEIFAIHSTYKGYVTNVLNWCIYHEKYSVLSKMLTAFGFSNHFIYKVPKVFRNAESMQKIRENIFVSFTPNSFEQENYEFVLSW